MKTSTRTTVVSLLAAVALITSTSIAFAQETKTLKEALKDKFLIGTAVNTRQASGQDKAGVRVIREQFNAIVAENCMKSTKRAVGCSTRPVKRLSSCVLKVRQRN